MLIGCKLERVVAALQVFSSNLLCFNAQAGLAGPADNVVTKIFSCPEKLLFGGFDIIAFRKLNDHVFFRFFDRYKLKHIMVLRIMYF